MSGLREALEKLTDDWTRGSDRGGVLYLAASTIGATLKAYPAEPAPVANRERVAEVLRSVCASDREALELAGALLAADVFRDEATVKAEAYNRGRHDGQGDVAASVRANGGAS